VTVTTESDHADPEQEPDPESGGGVSKSDGERPRRLARIGIWFDDRLGLARIGTGALHKIFPNHWSFLLGEVALYSFVVLIATGVYLTFFFNASSQTVVYDGSYVPVQGLEVSQAYDSALDLSFDIRAGLVMRQIHHWAALLFLCAITIHLFRIFFTGAFRRPREMNWIIGLSLLLLSLGNGFFGYSLLDDQLSGTGIRIAYSVMISIPFVGPWIASLLFGGNFPSADMIPRMFILHVLIIPAVITVLLAAHLSILIKHKHTHFAGMGAREDNVVGERLWPTYVFKALGLFFLVGAVLALLGGWAQINPIWLYGPFEPENVSSASQPDWYVGWLEGSLRIMPDWETRIGWFTIPNPFWGGALLPLITFGTLFSWPFLERRFTKDTSEHHVLDRPRDRPVRTAIGVAGITFYAIMLMAGADDVIAVAFNFSVNTVLHVLRVGLFVMPVVAGFVTWKLCHELQRRDPVPE
jgi:ubiquinol-cytochrome c reductase cytochrome b subunit